MRPGKEIREFFRKTRDKFLEDTHLQRRAVYRNASQQRAFMKGESTDWYDAYTWRWRSFEEHPNHDARRVPKYRYHINIYKFGWEVLQGAIQTTGIPGSIFIPQNKKQFQDREAARLAKPIIDYERSVIDYKRIWGKIFRYFYTDGLALVYERHVGGEEVVDIFGALECPLPWWANTLKDCPLVPIVIEVPKEEVIQTFPELESEIMNPSGDAHTEEDRRARIVARTPMRAYWNQQIDEFVTYGRWWFRPEVFYKEKEMGLRDELLTKYPDGAFVQFAGATVLDANPERVDDHVRLAKAFDGDGMYTPSVGQSGVPIQEATDTSFNMQLEAQEFAGFPPILVDRALLDEKSLKDTQMIPGQYKFIVVPLGKNLKDSVHQIVVKESSVAADKLIDGATKWMEILVGTSPSLAGAQMTNTRSAQQYNLAKNQALQRLAPQFESAKQLVTEIDEMLVHDFLVKRPEKDFQDIIGEQVNQQQLATMLSNRQGRVYARAEQSDSIPQTWAQKQTAIQQLLQSQNPYVQQALGESNILQLLFDSMGLPELRVRAKTLEDKVRRVIELLLDAEPVMREQPNPLDPQGELIEMPGPSIAFEPLFDDAQIVIMSATEWAASPEGMQAQGNNPKGFENVTLYVQAAALAMAQAVGSPPQEEKELETVSAA